MSWLLFVSIINVSQIDQENEYNPWYVVDCATNFLPRDLEPERFNSINSCYFQRCIDSIWFIIEDLLQNKVTLILSHSFYNHQLLIIYNLYWHPVESNIFAFGISQHFNKKNAHIHK